MDLLNYKPTEAFKHKHLLSLWDYSPDDVLQLLATGLRLKTDIKNGIEHKPLTGKSIGLYLSKQSARTRVSFEVGISQLGAQPVMLDAASIGLGVRESVADVAAVLSRYLDGLMIRTFAQAQVEELAAEGDWSVINGLTDMFHPCQALADLLTVYENFGAFKGVKLCYIGDGNNVAHSLLLGCAAAGCDITVCTPPGYEPDASVVECAQGKAKQTGATVSVMHDTLQAVKDARVLYTDVWTSMGQEEEKALRMNAFAGYSVTSELMRAAADDAIFLHCLPAHRGEEMAAEVIDGPQSRVFDQAENRLHMQKAVMALLMG
ncbi:MAG: ornithine carbamoyltransferase [Clostridia bacterium]|nr:ornithine carbamoyltransferase [Clostridia bacterium]